MTIDPDAERQLAIELFDLAWELLESPSRIAEAHDRAQVQRDLATL